MAKRLRTLIVEDSDDDLELITYELGEGGYDIEHQRVETAQEMNAALDEGGWDVVISDYSLPQFSAPEALTLVQEHGLDLPFIVVSGAIGEETAVAAMKAGAHDYVMKDNLARLVPAVDREIREAQNRRERREAEERERQLQRQLQTTAIETAKMLAQVVDERDRYTSGHCERLATYATSLGRQLGLPESRLDQLYYAGWLHDVGKVGIPDAILNKPQGLDDDEYEAIKTHVEIGARLVGGIHTLRPASEMIAQHHERWDGQGYPNGLSGEEILVEGRILAVVDAYDAMTSDRPYRNALSKSDAMAELRHQAGAQFDPHVVEAFEQLTLNVESSRQPK